MPFPEPLVPRVVRPQEITSNALGGVSLGAVGSPVCSRVVSLSRTHCSSNPSPTALPSQTTPRDAALTYSPCGPGDPHSNSYTTLYTLY